MVIPAKQVEAALPMIWLSRVHTWCSQHRAVLGSVMLSLLEQGRGMALSRCM